MMDRIDVSEFTRRGRPRPASVRTQDSKARKRDGMTYNAFLGFPMANLLASLFKRKKRPA